jgi:hypothetical protein
MMILLFFYINLNFKGTISLYFVFLKVLSVQNCIYCFFSHTYGIMEVDACSPKEYIVGKKSYGMQPRYRSYSYVHDGKCVFSKQTKDAARQADRNARVKNPRKRKNGTFYVANTYGPKGKPKAGKTHAQIQAITLKKPCTPAKDGRQRTRVQGGPAAGRCVLVEKLSHHLARGGFRVRVCEPKLVNGRKVHMVSNPSGSRRCVKAGTRDVKDKVLLKHFEKEFSSDGDIWRAMKNVYNDPVQKAALFKKYESMICNPDDQYFKVSKEFKKIGVMDIKKKDGTKEASKTGWNVGRCVARKGEQRKCPMGQMLYKKNSGRKTAPMTIRGNNAASKGWADRRVVSGRDIYITKCFPKNGQIPAGFQAISGSEGTHPGYNVHTTHGDKIRRLNIQRGECPKKQRIVKGVAAGPEIQQVRGPSGRCVFPDSKPRKPAGPRRAPAGKAKNFVGQSVAGSNGTTMYTPAKTSGGGLRWKKV